MKDFSKFLEGRKWKDEPAGMKQSGWSPEPSQRGLFPPIPTPVPGPGLREHRRCGEQASEGS